MTKKAYVIGAGLAGLSAATILAARGASVTLIEAAGQAGGRCRSYFDSAIGGVIDNGNHLVLSGNRAVHDYQKRIGAQGSLVGPPRAEFAFVDLKDGARQLRPPGADQAGQAEDFAAPHLQRDIVENRRVLVLRRAAAR